MQGRAGIAYKHDREAACDQASFCRVQHRSLHGIPDSPGFENLYGGTNTSYPLVMTVRFVYWQENGDWLGYIEEFTDYWTQGESLDDLKDHLRDL